jgi:AAA domain-containing protein/TrwC relaxase
MVRFATTPALDARRLFRPHMKMALGALFRVELARELQKIGVDCYRPVNDRDKRVSWFELSHVPPELLRAFSKRRQDMQAWMDERSLTGAQAAEQAALATRREKIAYARDDLFAAWSTIGREHDFDARQLFPVRRPLDDAREVRRQSELVLHEALEEITEQRARFSELELLRYTAQAAQCRSIGIDDVFQVVEHGIEHSEELVRLQGVDDERYFTTQEMLVLEERLLATVERLHTSDGTPVGGEIVEHVLSEYSTARQEQIAAVRHVTSASGRIACVNGLAGTGKTFMLQIAREAWERAGYEVLGTTLAAKASQTLAAGSGIESVHLHPLLSQLTPGQRRLTDRSVLVLDEAGMVGTRQLERLAALTEQAGAKLVLVGDHRQLQAIEAGAPFRAIAERLGAAELNGVIRQRHPWDLVQSAMHVRRVLPLQVEHFDCVPNNMVLANLPEPKRLDADCPPPDFRVPNEEAGCEILAIDVDPARRVNQETEHVLLAAVQACRPVEPLGRSIKAVRRVKHGVEHLRVVKSRVTAAVNRTHLRIDRVNLKRFVASRQSLLEDLRSRIRRQAIDRSFLDARQTAKLPETPIVRREG